MSALCRTARARRQLVVLSGSGADETMTDCASNIEHETRCASLNVRFALCSDGFNGRPIGPQSQFGGFWPDDATLRKVFPWRNFYEGTQIEYLAKDEYISGLHGVEGRFPFLDPQVVQENLFLSAQLKNSVYKAAIHLYFENNSCTARLALSPRYRP